MNVLKNWLQTSMMRLYIVVFEGQKKSHSLARFDNPFFFSLYFLTRPILNYSPSL